MKGSLHGVTERWAPWQQSALAYLLWVESQNPMIGAAEEQRGTTVQEYMGDICISYMIFESLNMFMSDSLLSRARACEDGRGLELWRKLHAERWKCAAVHCEGPEVPRSTTMSVNATAVRRVAIMGATGSDVLMGGYVCRS